MATTATTHRPDTLRDAIAEMRLRQAESILRFDILTEEGAQARLRGNEATALVVERLAERHRVAYQRRTRAAWRLQDALSPTGNLVEVR